MKTKHLIITCFILSASVQSSFGQYEVGNTWTEIECANAVLASARSSLAGCQRPKVIKAIDVVNACGHEFTLLTRELYQSNIEDSFLIRREGNHVFWRATNWPCEQKESMLYDFGAEVGDTIRIPIVDTRLNQNSTEPLKLIVLDKKQDNLILKANASIQINSKNVDSMIWNPEIGSSNWGLFYNLNHYNGEVAYLSTCHNDSVLDTTLFSSCTRLKSDDRNPVAGTNEGQNLETPNFFDFMKVEKEGITVLRPSKYIRVYSTSGKELVLKKFPKMGDHFVIPDWFNKRLFIVQVIIQHTTLFSKIIPQ